MKARATTSIIEKPVGEEQLRELQQALKRFGESSARLQSKYEMLTRESRMLQEQLEYERSRGQEDARLWALGQVAGALAHEIRNPLGAMKIFVSLLSQELQEKAPEALELLEHVDGSIDSLDSVLRNMLHFAQHKSLDCSPVNLRAIVEGCIEELKVVSPQMLCSIAEHLPDAFVSAHEESLRQIVRNLFKNAAESCEGTGSVAVAWKMEGDALVLLISDDGPGVPPEQRSRIFEPFVSTKSQGTGLGLAIVKRLLHKQHAEIRLLDCERGATFEIIFRVRHQVVGMTATASYSADRAGRYALATKEGVKQEASAVHQTERP